MTELKMTLELKDGTEVAAVVTISYHAGERPSWDSPGDPEGVEILGIVIEDDEPRGGEELEESDLVLTFSAIEEELLWNQEKYAEDAY